MSGPDARPVPGAFVDLHAHSTASDGARAPADVVREAARVGLRALALTDHDTLGGLAEASAAAAEVGLRLVRGVELSAVEDQVETHVLGLHLDDAHELEARLEELREMRRSRAERMVRRLNELGVRIDLQAVLDQAAGGAVGRPHVARAMVADGWANDFRDAFDRYLGNGRPAYVAKDQLAMREAIAMIHRAGGLAVVAHPGSYGTRERLKKMVDEGMDGVEVLHPSHTPDDIARLQRFSEQLGIVRSGGSDWHGGADGTRLLGAMRVPAEWLALQDERVAARREAVA